MPASVRKYGSANTGVWGDPIAAARDTVVAGGSSSTSVTVPTVTGFKQWIPQVTGSTNTNSPPSVGDATANTGGYRTQTDQQMGQTTAPGGVVFDPSAWSTRIRYSRSGGSNATATVTAIYYRMSSTGTFISEIARGNSASLTFTTTTQTATFNVTPSSWVYIDNTDVIQLDLFLNITGAVNAAVLRLHQEITDTFNFSFLPSNFTFVRPGLFI